MDETGVAAAGIISTAFVGSLAIVFGYISGRSPSGCQNYVHARRSTEFARLIRVLAPHTIGPLLRARPGLRVPGTWDPFETGVRAIIGQQASVAAANTITGRLVERLGIPVPGLRQLGLTHTFPAPNTLATADLTGLGLTRARSDAVRAFARAVAADAIRLDRSVSLDRLIASITAIDGLGPWTAHYLALRLGERDACP